MSRLQKASKILVIVLVGMLAMYACKPRRYSDLTYDEAAFDTPKIYKDTLASDKKKVTVKKPKRRVYYGIKTKKAFTKSVKGRNVTYELFYVLKKPLPPEPFITNIFWYHTKKKVVLNGPIPEKEAKFAKLLHGPYKKVLNRRTILEGVYYLGAKHARWEEYLPGDEEILVDKLKWYKGYSKEAEITYYDVEKKRIKEVKPYINDLMHGEYYLYAPNGSLLMGGRLEHGLKVGIWREFFDTRRKTKRVIQYGKDGFDYEFKPYISTEFDLNGVVIYDYLEEEKNKRNGKPFKEAPIPPLSRPSDTIKSIFKKPLLKSDSLRRPNPQGK